MYYVRLAGDHQNGKLLFTWLSLLMSFIVSFCAVFSHEMFWMRPGTEFGQGFPSSTHSYDTGSLAGDEKGFSIRCISFKLYNCTSGHHACKIRVVNI